MFQTVEFLFNIGLIYVELFYIFGTTAKEMKPPFLIVYFMTLLDDLRKTGLEMQIMLLHSGSKNGKNISVLTIFEITCTNNFNSSELKFKKKKRFFKLFINFLKIALFRVTVNYS